MVKRYENNYGDMVEDAEGYYVEYDDYAIMRKDRDYWYELCLAAGLLDNAEVEQ